MLQLAFNSCHMPHRRETRLITNPQAAAYLTKASTDRFVHAAHATMFPRCVCSNFAFHLLFCGLQDGVCVNVFKALHRPWLLLVVRLLQQALLQRRPLQPAAEVRRTPMTTARND